MTDLSIKQIREEEDRYVFQVTAMHFGEQMKYGVSVTKVDFERLSRDGETPQAFIERCFQFLLEREPMTAILARFDVSVIPKYFPDFEQAIARD